jgi:hypothetical protein
VIARDRFTFRVQRLEPDVVEGVDHPAYVLWRAIQQVRDVRYGLALLTGA